MNSTENTQQTQDKNQRFQGIVLMVIVALIWGSMPVAVKEIVNSVPPPVQIALRFTIGVVIFAPFTRNLNIPLLRDGTIIGLLMFGALACETIGLKTIAANQASFMFGLSIIFITLFEVVFYRRISLVALLAAAIAFTGIGVMTLQDSLPPIGEVWMLLCAIISAALVIVLEILAPRHEILPLTLVQLLVIAVLSWFWAAPQMFGHFEEIKTNLMNQKDLVALIYLGVVGTGIITWLQTKAMSTITAFEAGLIQTSEPVFGAMFAFLVLGESFEMKGYIGAAMVIVGMVTALSQRKGNETSEVALPIDNSSKLTTSAIEE